MRTELRYWEVDEIIFICDTENNERWLVFPVVVITSLFKRCPMKWLYLPFTGKLWCGDRPAVYVTYMKTVKPGPNSLLTVSISTSSQIFTFLINSFIPTFMQSFIPSLISPASASSGHNSRLIVGLQYFRRSEQNVFLLSTSEIYDILICGCLNTFLS